MVQAEQSLSWNKSTPAAQKMAAAGPTRLPFQAVMTLFTPEP